MLQNVAYHLRNQKQLYKKNLITAIQFINFNLFIHLAFDSVYNICFFFFTFSVRKNNKKHRFKITLFPL